MLIINTGNGKGKSTAAMGQILRSLGRGWNVCLIQFFKGTEFYGEQKLLKTFDHLTFYSFAHRHPGCFKDLDPDTVQKQCAAALQRIRKHLDEHHYDLIVFDELNIALRDKFIEQNDVFSLLDCIPKNTDVIITGRGAPKKLIARADLVTEMKEIKHPYQKGIPAKKGIEF
jgi:cob(I)alamin adenosyltransferase